MTKPLNYLSDLLCIESVTWDVQRNDELSGSGDGRVWQAELAPPLWIADIAVNINYHDQIKQLAARIRALHGSKEPFFINDPLSIYPFYDKTGALIGSNSITISSINAQRNLVSFAGFPAGYKLTFGDKFQVNYGTTTVRHAFIEIAGNYTANASGNISNVSIFPELPVGINTSAVAQFVKPACQMIIMPQTFNAGRASSLFTNGLTFKAIQKK